MFLLVVIVFFFVGRGKKIVWDIWGVFFEFIVILLILLSLFEMVDNVCLVVIECFVVFLYD